MVYHITIHLFRTGQTCQNLQDMERENYMHGPLTESVQVGVILSLKDLFSLKEHFSEDIG